MPKYRFDEIAINSTEKKKPTDEDKETYIGLEHLDSGSLYVKRWGSSVPIKGEKLVMRKGDVLLGKRNAYLRRAAIAPHDGIFSAHGMVLRPKEDVIDRDFFPLFIASDYFFDTAVRISVGSLSPTVNWKDLKVAEFELPSLEEQRKLAKALWAVIRTIEAYKELIEKTDELVKSQFIEMFGDPDTNPKQWAVKSIGDIATDVHYGTSKPAIEGGIYPYLRMNNLTADGYIDLTDLKYIDLPENELDGCLVHYGDILFNRTNSKEWVGKTALFDLDQDMVIAGYIIRVRVNSEVLPCFLVKYMNLPYMKKMLRGMAKGAVHQANINAKEMQSIKLYIPPLELQQQFAELVRQTDKSKYNDNRTIIGLIDLISFISNERSISQ